MAAKFKMASRRLTSVIKLSQTCVFCDNSMKISTHVAFFKLDKSRYRQNKKIKMAAKFKMVARRPKNCIVSDVHFTFLFFISIADQMWIIDRNNES